MNRDLSSVKASNAEGDHVRCEEFLFVIEVKGEATELKFLMKRRLKFANPKKR